MAIDDMIAVLRAAKEGKVIQFTSNRRIEDWQSGQRLGFNFDDFDYRVKPEPPKPREWDLRGEHVYEVGGAGSINALVNVGHDHIRVREVLEAPSVLESNEVR